MNVLHTHTVCGLTLSSNVPLPELDQAACSGTECEFHLLPSGSFPPEEISWFHQWHVEGAEENSPWVCFARYDRGYLLRFPSCGDFYISNEVTEIRCRPLPDIPDVTIRHLLLDQVIPIVLSRKGRVVFHASAISTESGAIAFAGKSGRGKSTLALAFARENHELITDDCLALRSEEGKWTVLPGYPGVRLWGTAADELLPQSASTADVAHYTSKRRIHNIDGIRFSKRPQPIRALFVLADEQPEISIQPLKESHAFMAWAEYAYNLDIMHADFLRGNFEAIGSLVTQIPAYVLYYPREFAMLSAVRAAILEQLEEANNDAE